MTPRTHEPGTSPTTIRLCTGELFDLLFPRWELVTTAVVARHLSRINRYTGALARRPVSVAEHALLVYELARLDRPDHPKLHRCALRHDDVEAVVGDASSPLKRAVPELRTFEKALERSYRDHLGLPRAAWPGWDRIAAYDHDAYRIESLLGWPDVRRAPSYLSSLARRYLRLLPDEREDPLPVRNHDLPAEAWGRRYRMVARELESG